MNLYSTTQEILKLEWTLWFLKPLSQTYSSRSYLANLYQNSHLSSLNVATSWTCSAKRAWSVRPSAATREILVCEKVNNPDTSVANKEAACPEAAAALFSASRPGDVRGIVFFCFGKRLRFYKPSEKRAAPLSADAPKIWPVAPWHENKHLRDSSSPHFSWQFQRKVLQGTLLQAQLLRLTSAVLVRFEWMAGNKTAQKVTKTCKQQAITTQMFKKRGVPLAFCISLFGDTRNVGVPPKRKEMKKPRNRNKTMIRYHTFEKMKSPLKYTIHWHCVCVIPPTKICIYIYVYTYGSWMILLMLQKSG